MEVKLSGPVGVDAEDPRVRVPDRGNMPKQELAALKYEIEQARATRAIEAAIIDYWLKELRVEIDPKVLEEEKNNFLRKSGFREQLKSLIERFGEMAVTQWVAQVQMVARHAVEPAVRRGALAQALVGQKKIADKSEFPLWLQAELKHVRLLRTDLFALFVGSAMLGTPEREDAHQNELSDPPFPSVPEAKKREVPRWLPQQPSGIRGTRPPSRKPTPDPADELPTSKGPPEGEVPDFRDW
jgi:hypothetical protein